MKGEMKEMLDFCDNEELVEDLSYPESLEIENTYSFEIRMMARKELGEYVTVHDFINFCEKEQNG